MTTLLDFYRQHGISPVKQDIGDLEAHFQRRAFLYRSLGLAPMAIKWKTVLEVGPGSGENALYTLSLNPSLYQALEPNPVAANALRELCPRMTVTEDCIEDFAKQYKSFSYDVVLCEGLLGLSGSDSLAILNACLSRVVIGGVLVITCIDPISDCAETIRRAMAHRLIDKSWPLQKQVDTLKPVFAPHLATLKGMTRSVEDWIVDNLLNPASIGPTFSIPDALTALEGKAEVLGCSPRFLVDWRWYKDGQPGNAWAIEAYWEQAAELIDYRGENEWLQEYYPREIYQQCVQIRQDVAAVERGAEPSSELQKAIQIVEADPGWFGRGQQYLSVVRTA